jgi:uncharacterized membrane protein
MAFCEKCGSTVAEGVAFCPQCGAPAGAAAVPPPPPSQAWTPTPAAPASGLQENVAGMLCYILGWVTGIVFLLIDKRPFVRFHAAQSIVVFGVLSLVRIVLAIGFTGGPGYGFFSLWALISMLVSIVTVVAWIVLIVFAFQGKQYEVPGAGPIARNLAGSAPV